MSDGETGEDCFMFRDEDEKRRLAKNGKRDEGAHDRIYWRIPDVRWSGMKGERKCF